MRIVAMLVATVLIAGCSKSSPPPKGSAIPTQPPETRVVATVEGIFDGTTLTLRPISAELANALVDIPVVQDGTQGTNPPDTLELVTASMATITGGCGAGLDAFRASVTARSFFPKAILSNVYFEIVRMTPAGREACNSFSPAPAGTTNQFGLFPYGTLDRFGTGANATTATWDLRLPDQSQFSFTGRVVADVFSDTIAPATVGLPTPGPSGAPIWFEPACQDNVGGSGCDAIYYTLDGTPPTTASTRLVGGISISATTTVNVFSVDLFGNAEPYQSLTYVFDTVPPTVASTVPAAGTWTADGSAPISVTFSEPVDPYTVSIVLGDGSNFYPFLPDAEGITFTYQEPSPGFPPGTVLRLAVGSAEDLMGNAMVQQFSTTIAIGGPAALTAAPGGSVIVNQALVPNFRNDLLAVWSETTGGGSRLFTALKFADQSWGAPVLLDEGLTTAGAFPARVADTFWGFLVVWSGPSSTRAALFDIDSGARLWTRDLWASASDAGSFDVIQGYGILVAARAAGGSVELRSGYSDGTWGPNQTLASHATASWPRLVNGPETYLRVFYVADDAVRVVREDPAQGTGWRTSEAIPGAGYGTPIQVAPVAFRTATGIEAVWAAPTGGVFASEDPGTGFGAPLELSTPGSDPALELVASGESALRAVAWTDPSVGVLGAVFEDVAWSAVQPIRSGPDAKEISIAGSWDLASVGNAGVRVTPMYYFPPFVWSDEFGWRADTLIAPARGPRAANAGPTTLTWAQQGPSADTLWWNDALAQSASPLALATSGAEAFDVSAVVSRAGVEHAAWLDASTMEGSVQASWFQAGGAGWLDYALAPPRRLVTAPVTVACGEKAWTFYGSGDALGDGAWSLEGALSSGVPDAFVTGLGTAPELAAAGHPDRAVVVYADDLSVGAALTVGGAWNGTVLSTWPGPSTGLSYPSAAAGGSGLLVGWRNSFGRPEVASPDVSFPSYSFAPTLGAEGPRVAVGDPTGPALPAGVVAWHAGGKVFASVFAPGIGWGAPEAITPAGTTCGTPELASAGSSFLAVFPCGSELLAARYDGAAWSTTFNVASAPLAFSVAGAPAGFRIAAVLADEHAYQVKITGVSAAAPERIDAGTGAVRPQIKLNADIGFFCAGWSQVVSDPLAARAQARCFL